MKHSTSIYRILLAICILAMFLLSAGAPHGLGGG